MKKGEWFLTNIDRLTERHWINVTRVAKNNSWADIRVMNWAVMWTKRQPLIDGKFAFEVFTTTPLTQTVLDRQFEAWEKEQADAMKEIDKAVADVMKEIDKAVKESGE